MKGALSTMLASMPETPGFDDSVFDAAFSIAKQHGFFIPKTVKMTGGSLFFLAPQGTKGDTIGALLPVGPTLKGQLYVSYVGGLDLKPIFEKSIFGTDDFGASDESKATQVMVEDFSLVCDYVLSEALGRRHINTATSDTAEMNPPKVT